MSGDFTPDPGGRAYPLNAWAGGPDAQIRPPLRDDGYLPWNDNGRDGGGTGRTFTLPQFCDKTTDPPRGVIVRVQVVSVTYTDGS